MLTALKCMIHTTPDEFIEESKKIEALWFEEGGELIDIIEKYGSQRYKDYIHRSLED